MQLLVQKKDKLDAEKAIKFIEKCKNAKLAIVHSSARDEVVFLNFFQSLVEKLKTPFAGMRVSGTATPEGYVEDAVAIAVLCGDFDVKVFHEKINFNEPSETVKEITPKLKGWKLCLIHSANTYKQNVIMDFILRRVQSTYPDLQIWGGLSSPPPLVATNDGIHSDCVLCTTLNGLETDFDVDTGFKFSGASEEFTITKCDEFHVLEINGKNVVEEYSKIQHMRPYFLNMLMKYLLTKSDLAKIAKSLFKASAIIRESGLRVGMKLLGTIIEEGVIEPFIALELGDEKESYLLTQSYKPEDTILKRTKTSKEDQLAVYDNLYKKFSKPNSMLMVSCAATQYWIDFDYKALEEKLEKFKCPFLLSYVFGEFGATLPYKGMEQNVVHGGTVKALAFR